MTLNDQNKEQEHSIYRPDSDKTLQTSRHTCEGKMTSHNIHCIVFLQILIIKMIMKYVFIERNIGTLKDYYSSDK